MAIDDLSVTWTTVLPTITGAATASAFTTTYGTASGAQSFSVSGSNLTANLVATAQTGFEVATSENGTYGSSVSLTQSSGSASGTVWVRLRADATAAGSYNGVTAVALTSTNATPVNITTAASGNSVSKATPSLSITSANSATAGGSVALTASSPAASGAVSASTGAVTYSSSDTGVVSISSTTANAVAAGTATITATQAADSNYNQAQATQSFTVNALSGTITPSTTSLSALTSTPYGTASTASSFTVSGSGLTGNLTVAAPSGFEVSTSEGGGYATSLTLTATGGSVASTAIYVRLAATTAAGSYSGNINISGGSASAQTVSIGSSTVTKADQASVTGSFAASTITFGQTGSVTGSGGSGTGAYELRSTGGSGVVTFTGTTINVTTAGTADIEIRRLGDTNYNASGWVSVGTLTINKASQTITGVATPMTKTFGDAAYSLGAAVGSGLTLSYASDNTAVATVSSAGLVTIVGAGSANITVSQSGNDNYNAATPVTQALTVNKANQTITFGALASKTTADAPFSLTGTTTAAGLTVSYTSSNPGVATVLGNTVTIVGVGTTTITASQPGNDNYNAATPVARSLSVTGVLSLTEIFVPQTIQGVASGTSNAKRTPYIFRATLNGLLPNATYRYFTGAVISSDTATSSGAGLPIFITSSGNFTRATSGSLSTAGSYAEFTTDPIGSFTGWFGLEPSGNARFATAGNSLQFRITLNDGNNGTTAATYLTTTSSATVTVYATTGSNSGTGIWGSSAASAQNFVLLYDNVTGTGRPVAGAIIESDGVDNTTNYPGFYSGNVNGVAGAWGTIIPNSLANGILRIENRSRAAGSLVAANTDADGVWPSGANTVNPTGGDTTVIALTSSDARLGPVISTTGSLSGLTTSYGTASAATSFSISGLNLTTGITIAPPSGFEVSTDSNFSSNVGTAASPLVAGAAGTISSTTVYVRLAASTAAGSYSGNIQLTSTGATGVNVATVSSTVSKVTPTITSAPTAAAITFGQSLASSTLSGGTGSVPGSFAFTSTSATPSGAGSYSTGITFTPTDTTNYNNASGTVTVTVNKANPTVGTAPTATMNYGQTLSSAVLSGGSATGVGGTLLAGSYALNNPSSYPSGIGTSGYPGTFTPSDTTNYNTAAILVSVTVGYASVDGATVSQNFQVSDLAVPLSQAAGWSSNDPTFRPDGYANDSLNAGNILGYVGGFVNAPANATTQLTYNFTPGNSNRYVFQWNQNITTSSNDFPGDDVFGWKFLSGANKAFEIRFLNDSSTGRDLLVQGYDSAGNALTLASGQPNDWFLDRNDPNDFRVTADLANKKWALDVYNKATSSWFGLVANASIDPSFTSLNGVAATWTVADNTFDSTTGQYLGAGDNIMSFDNLTIQGKQTVVIALNLPGSSPTYNGLSQAISPTTTPSGVAVVVKYNGSTTPPVNVGTYTVTAEVVDTTTYYSAPTSGSLTVSKATPTISASPSASGITYGQTLADSTLSGGTGSVAGSFAFTSPSTAPNAGTANQGITFTPSDTANYNNATGTVSVTVAKATPTIATAPTASAINAGQNLSASSLTGGSATGVGGAPLAGSFGFTSPSTVPSVGIANQSVTFTPTDTANYNTVTGFVSVTVIPATTPAEDYLSSFGLSGANAALSADPDNDGLTNAAEFAFGTSPVAATGTPVNVSDSGSNVTITFLGRTTGVDYVVKTTTDLSVAFSGSSAPAASSPQPSGLPAGYTQYEASVDTTSGERNFLKVDATLQ